MSVQPPTRELAEDLAGLNLNLRRGAYIFAIDDPFPSQTYQVLFETRLFYHDMTIEVERVRSPRAVNASGYDAVFGF